MVAPVDSEVLSAVFSTVKSGSVQSFLDNAGLGKGRVGSSERMPIVPVAPLLAQAVRRGVGDHAPADDEVVVVLHRGLPWSISAVVPDVVRPQPSSTPPRRWCVNRR